MLSNLKSKTVLGGRWEVTSVVGEGACAQVYTVRPTQSTVGYELVAKVVPFTGGSSKAHKQQDRICNTLNYEYMMYNGLLNGFPFCPRVPEKFYGDDKELKVRYLVMERMDRDLVAVANSGTVPSSSYTAQLGITILEGLKWIHQKNFLFIDVKPANFMLKGDKLYFVDCKFMQTYFGNHIYDQLPDLSPLSPVGLVERLQVMPAGKTAPSHTFAGTPTFCSVALDNGEQSGAHDDLEALVCLVFIVAVQLVVFRLIFDILLLGLRADLPHQRRPPALVRGQVRRRAEAHEGGVRCRKAVCGAGHARGGGADPALPQCRAHSEARLRRPGTPAHHHAGSQGEYF